MKDADIHTMMELVKEEIEELEGTAVGDLAKKSGRDPFKVLISTLISSRTKDEVTAEASSKLFAEAGNPSDMLKLSREEIQELIYPAGFYKNKSKYILDTCQTLLDEYDGEVPDTIDELVQLSGVGRKTANLVLTTAFQKPAICVDTHVHRICNRWGYIDTKRPQQTEMKLRDKLPKEYWIPINPLLVTFGQNICKPISPHCSDCSLEDHCEQNDVDQHR